MRLLIDTTEAKLTVTDESGRRELPLYSPAAFSLLNEQWVKVGWSQKYSYSFSWMGRPVIQLPEDMIRIQEVIFDLQPDVILETGVAHGGSLIYYSSLCKALGRGRVIGIDVKIRPHNRRAIEEHPLADLITLIEGDSTAEETLAQVRRMVRPDERALVVLDSCHTRDHVLKELRAYRTFVPPGSYLVAT